MLDGDDKEFCEFLVVVSNELFSTDKTMTTAGYLRDCTVRTDCGHPRSWVVEGK